MKQIAAGAVVVFVIIIMLAFVTTILATIDPSNVVGTPMETSAKTITQWSTIALTMMTPLTILLSVGLLVIAVYTMLKK